MVLRTLGGLLAWLGLTVLQGVLLLGLAMLGWGVVHAVGGGLGGRLDDLALGAALLSPIMAVVAAEVWLTKTPVAWLRLSQNPIFLLPP